MQKCHGSEQERKLLHYQRMRVKDTLTEKETIGPSLVPKALKLSREGQDLLTEINQSIAKMHEDLLQNGMQK